MLCRCFGATVAVALIGYTSNFVAAGPVQQPSGFYVMQAVHQQNVRDDVLATPQTSGIHLRDTWAFLEPAVATNSFSWLDDQVSRAKRLGKSVTLGVYTGIRSPTWLGVPLVDGVPIPWDPVVNLAHQAMVADLGAHFGGDPAISAVHISSPAMSESLEMFLPDGLTNVAGYTDQKIIDVWKSSIDAYASAFPNQALVLDVAMAPDADGDITDAVIDYAQTKLGDRINFIHCSLKATTSAVAPHHTRVVNAHREGSRIGFEMVSRSSDVSRFGGEFADALAIGQSAGAAWYQIYQSDIPEIPNNFFSVAGDYNHDGEVDAEDYIVWRNGVGGVNLVADGDGNGRIDGSDYTVWRANIGAKNAALASSAVSVPEPGSCALVYCLCGMVFGMQLVCRCQRLPHEGFVTDRERSRR